MHRFLAALWPLLAFAQSQPSLNEILDRLNRLEKENASLKREVGKLREEVASLKGVPDQAPPAANVEELAARIDIQEKRTAEQAQTKVEASQRFPLRITGMALVNLYHNGPLAGGAETPITASSAAGRQIGGITFRQSIIGLEYSGPQTFLGGKLKGSIFVDFYQGATEGTNFYTPHVRTAGIEVDWSTRSLSIVQEKPLIAPRDPQTFSYSGISPLTGAGNLWRWQPQVRFEQRFRMDENTQARAQVALIQTWEDSGFNASSPPGFSYERRRPGLEGRFEVAHKFRDERRVEIAPSFHWSESNVNGRRIPSKIASVDWLAVPFDRLRFSGTFWSGENTGHFGTLNQSFVFLPGGIIRAVQSKGGWGQLSIPITQRLTFNAYGGVHDDRNADLARSGMAANRVGALNLVFRVAPNVLVSAESMQTRTTYLDVGVRKNNRYDLSVAYLF